MNDSFRNDIAGVFIAQRPKLLSHARALLRNDQQAEDVVQECYIRASHAALRTEIANPAAFLFRTTHNLALDLLRQQQRRPAAPLDTLSADEPRSEVPGVEEALMSRERLETLAAALSGLPPRMVEVMILSRLRGWPHHRIAQELGVAERTVFNDLRAALLHCRAALEDAAG